MKKKILTLISLLVIVMSFTSCGAKKIVKHSYPDYTTQGYKGPQKVTEVKEDIDECEAESINEPPTEIRSYGNAISESYDFARQKAILSAKAALIARLETNVVMVMKNYREDTQVNGKLANEEQVKQDIGEMAERVLENCRVVCSNRFRLSDGTYKSAVCIAIPAATAEKITGAAVLSDDERLGVQFHAKEFQDSYRDELERFRQQMKERH